MRAIRQFRQALNMAVTSADLLNLAPIEMQLQWLSHGADSACALLADWLERQARQRGRLRDNARWFILAMGKLGAGELNFSSDIDLIVLYDSDADDSESGRVFVDMAREFTQIMGRPTAHGIGWRVDFRLRPNPSVTAVAMRVDNAMSYYEALARTWERVAFIRARVIAGDRDAGAAFLDEIEVFIWRRYLDYAVLDDMKLMLQREPKTPELYGYNVKKGAGGIRAIEFAVHVQQLIAAGGSRVCAHLPRLPPSTPSPNSIGLVPNLRKCLPAIIMCCGGWNTASKCSMMRITTNYRATPTASHN